MLLDDLAGACQTDPGTDGSVADVRAAPVSLENVRHILLRDPDAFVADPYDGPTVFVILLLCNLDDDLTAVRAVFDRVVEQVVDQPAQPEWIPLSSEDVQLGFDRDLVNAGGQLGIRGGGTGQGNEVGLLGSKVERLPGAK